MTGIDVQIPRKFDMAEFHEMLVEFVNDARAREALLTYIKEDTAGRGQLSDSSTSSELAFDSFGTFRARGWEILSEHGWPKYSQLMAHKDQNLKQEVDARGWEFIRIAQAIIGGRGDKSGQAHYEIDVADRNGVFSLLKEWAEKNPNHLPYSLTGEE